MLKLVVIGIWVAVVTAGVAYFSAGFFATHPEAAAGEHPVSVEQLSTEMTSVPMIRDGEVLGYVIIQLNYAIDKDAIKKAHIDPLPYLIDAAFRAVYLNPQADFAKLRASDIEKLTEAIKAEANRRLGEGMVQEVLLAQLNFVRKQDIRTNWVKQNH